MIDEKSRYRQCCFYIKLINYSSAKDLTQGLITLKNDIIVD